MFVKMAFLFISSCVVIMALPVPDVTTQLQGVPQQSIQGINEAVGEVANRLGAAYVTTYDQQRESLYNTLNKIREMGTKGIESGMGIIRNGIELIFFIPRFGRNMLVRIQQQPQQQIVQAQI